MADEPRQTASREQGGNETNGGERQDTVRFADTEPTTTPPAASTPPVHSPTTAPPAASTLPAHSTPPGSPAAASLHRAGTLPVRRPYNGTEDVNRRRGRTISSRSGQPEGRQLSPRSQLFGRGTANVRSDNAGDGGLGHIPEGENSRRRESFVSERSFVSPGLRHRTTTVRASAHLYSSTVQWLAPGHVSGIYLSIRA